MSLNAIFKYPDLYHTAMAVAPVPNQRYYDTIYQERYMGLPGDNVEGYRRVADQLCRSTAGQPAARPRHGRRQLPLPGHRGVDQRVDPPQQAVHDDGLPQPLALDSRGNAHQPAFRELLTRYLQQNLPPGPRAP